MCPELCGGPHNVGHIDRSSWEATNAPAAVILIRLIVGCVLLSEGIQKFLFADALGVGRFTKIGIPAPEVMAPFVGGCETVCGLLSLAEAAFSPGQTQGVAARSDAGGNRGGLGWPAYQARNPRPS
jgi:hypothetical protein